MKNKVAGAILAGGTSVRFGKDKASHIYQGRSFLNIMKNILVEAGLTTPYISRSDQVSDIHKALGPISGIHAILTHLRADYDSVIFVPIDMPRLTPKLLKQLIEAPLDNDLIFFEQHKFPFRLACHDNVLEQLEWLLTDRSNLSLGYLFERIDNRLALTLNEEDVTTLININTPSDLRYLD